MIEIKQHIKLIFMVLCLILVFGVNNSNQNQLPLNSNKKIPIDQEPRESTSELTEEWYKIWGGSNFDEGHDIFLDNSGNIYISGHTMSYGAGIEDVITIKYNSSINVEWSKTYGGSNYDAGRAVLVDSSGNVYSCGVYNDDALIIKYDSNGNLLWTKTWAGISPDSFSHAEFDSLGNIVLCGTTQSKGAGGNDILVAKYDSSGTEIWNTTWGGSDMELGAHLTVGSNDDIYVIGSTKSFGSGDHDIVVLKYNSSGSLLWSRIWGGIGLDRANGIAIDSSNNIYAIGWTENYGAGLHDVVLIKYNNSGNMLWNKTWGGSSYDGGWGGAIAIGSDGYIYCVSNTESYGAGGNDFVFLKFDSAGNLIWDDFWGGSGDDRGHAILFDDSGNLYTIGDTSSYGAGLLDIVFIKFGGVIGSGEQEDEGDDDDDDDDTDEDSNDILLEIPGYNFYLLVACIGIPIIVMIYTIRKRL
ncbi:MAG: hypothetical protein ACTSQJ_03430 [Promethearchaeota archaeon]